MEIRHAEKIIEQIKKGTMSIPFGDSLLPTNNWEKNNYLFIKNLDRDELDLINNFYNQCSQIDKSITQLSVSTQLEQKASCIHQTLAQIAKESIGQADFDNKKKNFLNIIEKDPYSFSPRAPKDRIAMALNNLINVTTSTAGNKLKKIAKID